MVEHWIPASKAIEIVQDKLALCSRLHAGLISARADLLIIDHKEEREAAIPRGFWWAEGHAALVQDWRSGDFETWIDQKVQCKAFGVTLALSQVLEMIAFEKRALIARSLSVAGDPDWISARDARRIALQHSNTSQAGEKIIELAKLGFVAGRAVLLEAYRSSPVVDEVVWEQREWNIEPWFWKGFTLSQRSKQNWDLGKFSGSGDGPTAIHYVMLSGVYFHRASLAALEGPKAPEPEVEKAKRGRKPEYDWAKASSEVWGKLYRGDLKAQNQADIELALIESLTVGDKSPGESTVRPYAQPIWEQYVKP